MADALRQLEKVGAMRRRLLPEFLALPPGWQVAVHSSFTPWPGGDFHDLFPLGDGRYLLFVADAIGHGGPAAALVAMARVVIHSCPLSSGCERFPFCPLSGRDPCPPHVLLGRLNQVLEENSLHHQFMTAFLGFLDPADGALEFAIAGHPLPRWWQASAPALGRFPDCAGLPLGIDRAAVYPAGRLHLGPGDILAIHTDGLTEARNPHDEMFGTARLDALLRANSTHDALAIQKAITDECERFLEGKSPEDDVTLMILKRAG